MGGERSTLLREMCEFKRIEMEFPLKTILTETDEDTIFGMVLVFGYKRLLKVKNMNKQR